MIQLLFKINQDKILKKLEEVKFTSAELKIVRSKIPNCNNFYWWDFKTGQGIVRDKQGKMWTWKAESEESEPEEKETVLKHFYPQRFENKSQIYRERNI